MTQTSTLDLAKKNTQLWQDYQDKKTDNRMLFPTEGAKMLKISEFELLLASPYSRYIGQRCSELLKALTQFHQLESITRNDYAVHEKLGVYDHLNLGDKMGLMLNIGGLDLRYFIHKWKYMLSVEDISNAERPIHSVQFFDEQGNAVNKVYLKSLEQLEQWQDLISNHISKVENSEIALEPLPVNADWQPNTLSDEDQQTLQDKWLAMTDVHQFFGILNKLQLDRASSYRQAPEGMAFPLKVTAIEPLFNKVKEIGCPLMTFVGNTGLVQIQTGTVQTIKRMGDWINILDKDHNDFTLHLNDTAVAQLWCVKRPTKDGLVTCVEAFDDKGKTIVTFFGQRMEGEPERTDWVQITNELVQEFGC